MSMQVVGLLELALNLLLPPRCVGCHREGSFLCDRCMKSAPALAQPYCRRCAQPGVLGLCKRCSHSPLAIDGVTAPFLMQDLPREAVHRLKYANLRALARPMASAMAEVARQQGWQPQLMTPVPLHPKRMHSRGYNQALLLAKGVGRILELPVEELLQRVRDTPSMARGMTREERFASVDESFLCLRPVGDRSILLVDDVCTTGATLSACARALKSAGAAVVWGLTFTREP